MIVKNNLSEIQSYFSDAANYQGKGDAVFFPETSDEISQILKDANRSGTKVTISGNGTGLTGGRVPEGGIVISTKKLNRIISINTSEKFALTEVGVTLSEFKSKTEQAGLFYPPDPTENECFIGGTIATNASGAKSFKYGATRNFVESLEIVLPDGDFLKLNRGDFVAENYNLKLITESGREIEIEIPELNYPKTTKNAAGYYLKPNMDAIDLFIGAEGTLGVVTKAKLKLIDLPKNFISAVIFFSNVYDALDFIADARSKSYETRKNQGVIDALALEFFDKNSLQFLKSDFDNINTNFEAAVWFEQEIFSDEDLILNEWIDLIEEHNGDIENSWIAVDDKKRREFKFFRHAVSQKISEYVSQMGIRKVGTDTAVPHSVFNEFYNYSIQLVEKNQINYVIYGHFGDSHMHLNMLPKNENEFDLAKKLYFNICAKAVELNGTVSAEHGIGKLKRKYFELMYSEKEILQMAKIKKMLDPNFILNFGNIFSEKLLIQIK